MQFAPDGRLFVCEKSGRLRVIKEGVLLPAPFVTVTVNDEGERGMLGVAIDPHFDITPYVYVYYTVPAAAPGRAQPRQPVHRRRRRGGAGQRGRDRGLNDAATTHHNAGAIDFGADGMLYIAVGDELRRHQRPVAVNAAGQAAAAAPRRLDSRRTTRSISPRPDPTGRSGPTACAIRSSSRSTAAARRRRCSSTMSAAAQFEEVNDGVPGANYGYPAIEGYDRRTPTTRARFTPTTTVPTAGVRSPAGHSTAPPAVGRSRRRITNAYFFADFCAGFIRRLDPAAGNTVTPLRHRDRRPGRSAGFRRAPVLPVRSGRRRVSVAYGVTAAAIVAHPATVIVSPGHAATSPCRPAARRLTYQWQRFRCGNWTNIGAIQPRYTLASRSSPTTAPASGCSSPTRWRQRLQRRGLLTVTPTRPPVADDHVAGRRPPATPAADHRVRRLGHRP